jgi:DNA-binding transcriptional regulator LsrR (DeoR family)
MPSKTLKSGGHVSDSAQHRSVAAVSLEAAIVARRYYIDDKRKSEIADELGMSRFKVARLLDEAKASGIVRIYVDMPAELDLPLGERVARAYGIQRAIVVRTFDQDADSSASILGAAAAEYLRTTLADGKRLGISWGTSLTAVVDAVTTLPEIEVVQLVGGVREGKMDVGGVELVRRLSGRAGGHAFPLHAPLLVRTEEMASELRTDPSLSEAIGRFATLDVALVGVGSWNPPRSSLFAELTESECNELRNAGAVADLCSRVFGEDGRAIESSALRRTVGITVDELRAIPEVVAVAGGSSKVAAIAAVIRSGIVNTLVTDAATAAYLVERA